MTIGINPFQQSNPVLTAHDDGGIWIKRDELINPYNTNPNGTNVTQMLVTPKYSVNYSQTSTTSTTQGWDASLSTTGEYRWDGFINPGRFPNYYVSGQNVSITAKAGMNGGTTNTIIVTTDYSDLAPLFAVPVPAGCKAVVTRKLGSATISGDYTFTAIVDKAQLKFNTVTGAYNSSYINSGYVDLVDLIKFGNIAHTAVTVDANNNILLNGKGKYTATGAYTGENGENLYIVTVVYEEATPGTNYCVAPESLVFENTLASSENSQINRSKIKSINHGFSYTILSQGDTRKTLDIHTTYGE